ncbi:SDR family oxidoreductase [Streptomyces sp. NBC_01278]|uniref:SDR family oxidoreductase n=1 Tax=unclassified Streptomyces TaxID=2593676 RepID=UPI002E2FE36A|nr:SDR family oxidoreductase [Streptomyces sp. NBC_01278]
MVASGRACRASRVRSSSRSIRVNAVSPGATRTRLSDDAFTRFPEVIPELAARTAFGRVGEPEDIGEMVATLIGEESRRVTAQNIEVSGGYQLKEPGPRHPGPRHPAPGRPAAQRVGAGAPPGAHSRPPASSMARRRRQRPAGTAAEITASTAQAPAAAAPARQVRGRARPPWSAGSG